MRIEDIEYTVDGRRLIGQVAVDEYRRGPRPCVLVCHEGPGLDVLLAQENADPSRVAAIGYCFGGVMALELARDGADLSAIVGFHSGAPTPAPQESRNISGRVLYCWGSADPFVSREARLAFEDDLTEAGVADWRIELYGGVGHCFTNPMVDGMAMPGVKYDAAADARSWRSALRLLDETLSPGEG
jgi:dienelactone hydrolase